MVGDPIQKHENAHPNKHAVHQVQSSFTIIPLLKKGGKHHRIAAGISVTLILVVGFIIGFINHFIIFFMFLCKAAIVLRIVNNTVWILIYVNITTMISFSIGLIGEFHILRMIIHPLGYLTAPTDTLYITKILSLGDCRLELFYFSLKRKYQVLYLGVLLKLDLVLDLIVIYF